MHATELIAINQEEKTCQIKGKTFPLEEVERLVDLLELVYDSKPMNGLSFKNEDLAWCLWGIEVLKPFKVTRPIFEGVVIKWKVGPNFLLVYDYIKTHSYKALMPTVGFEHSNELVQVI